MDPVRIFEQEQIGQTERPKLRAGDLVRVEMKVTEGEKSRLQIFEGTILGIRGSGPSTTFTVRRETGGFGVERIFPLYSPLITGIEIVKRQKIRRAKLTYLRQEGRRRFQEDIKAMQRHVKLEERKRQLAEDAKKKAEEEKEEALRQVQGKEALRPIQQVQGRPEEFEGRQAQGKEAREQARSEEEKKSEAKEINEATATEENPAAPIEVENKDQDASQTENKA